MAQGRADARYETDGGWKVHLTVGPDSYERKVMAIKRWLEGHLSDHPANVWKNLHGGDRHEKDFTVYLGSYATMVEFVKALEASAVYEHLEASNAGSADRRIGLSDKCGARFDPRGVCAGRDWERGWNGIPFTQQDVVRKIGGAKPGPLAEVRKIELRQLFGEYFLPEGVD